MPAEAQLWPADRVERRPVAILVPYARNARTHSPEQVDQIAASICEWGWTVPVLVDPAFLGLGGGHQPCAAQHRQIRRMAIVLRGNEQIHGCRCSVIGKNADRDVDQHAFAVAAASDHEYEGMLAGVAGKAVAATDTQLVVLSAAAARLDRSILPLPPHLKGGAVTKVCAALLAKGLAIEIEAGSAKTLVVSNAAREALGIGPEVSQA